MAITTAHLLLLLLAAGLRASAAEESPAPAAGRCCTTDAGCIDPEGCMDPAAQPFCAASKQNCETKCKHAWCSSGGGGGSSSHGRVRHSDKKTPLVLSFRSCCS
jgi:hypothetical protein